MPPETLNPPPPHLPNSPSPPPPPLCNLVLAGFTSGFFFAAFLLFISMIKWPTEDERAAMVKEIDRARKLGETKASSHIAVEGDSKKEKEGEGSEFVATLSTTDSEVIHKNVFEKDDSKKEEAAANEDGKEVENDREEDTDVDTNETPEERKERLRKEEAEKVHKVRSPPFGSRKKI